MDPRIRIHPKMSGLVIRIWIYRIHMFLGFPAPDPLVWKEGRKLLVSIIYLSVQGRTSTVDVEISTAVLLSGVSMEATHSFLNLLKIATNHTSTCYNLYRIVVHPLVYEASIQVLHYIIVRGGGEMVLCGRYLLEFIDWIYSMSYWYFQPSFVNCYHSNLLSGCVNSPPPAHLPPPPLSLCE